ncbi:hypothetical protein [Novosphingobium resinovorum]|jgi:hypothetical protein|uniref:Uncharacterized protein n=1 Tax=Novosphingobium resinovorum TaxID=158500 RepID=A0A1D8A5D7_9SPHN|nr:hypothetical protein [Novosphingobium resinovorum]AOR77337.1 hypothetical protein BES08_11670 [Novosphingobium resinovorum]
MTDPNDADRIDAATSRIVDLEAELEASGTTTREAEALARVREVLHQWVDTVSAVVATPGVGRVVLIHENGSESRIASPELPFLLAVPVTFGAFSQRD